MQGGCESGLRGQSHNLAVLSLTGRVINEVSVPFMTSQTVCFSEKWSKQNK